MINKKIKVLHATVSSTMGGRTRYIFGLWESIDKSRFQFDFATFSKSVDYKITDGENCFKMHYLPCYPSEDQERFAKEWNRILDEDYDIVHLHTGFWNGYQMEELTAKRGSTKIIIHSHNTGIGKYMNEHDALNAVNEHYRMRESIDLSMADDFWACSYAAKKWLFGERITDQNAFVTYPTIDEKRFTFNEEVREKSRDCLCAQDSYIIGTVGRLVPQKNQLFLLRLMPGLLKLNSKICLMIVGGGQLKDELEKEAEELGISDSIIWTGECKDPREYYQAMDLFVLPSLYEGFPKVVLEALAVGLTCICADTITEEIEIDENVMRISLEYDEWENAIARCMNDKNDRRCRLDARFSSLNEIGRIEERYLGLVLGN